MKPADDATPARAVLLTILWDTKEVLWTFYEGDDAGIKAEGLKRGIAGDFDNSTSIVWSEGDARDRLGEHRLKQWGILNS